MDDILAKKNRHLFLEEKDNQNNSFIGNINDVANRKTELDTVAAHITNVDTIGNHIDNVDIVANNIEDINNASTNINTVKTFNDNVNNGTMQYLLEAFTTSLNEQGNAWEVRLTQLGESILATTSAFNYSTVVTVSSDIPVNGTLILPNSMKYKVGTHMLMVSWNGTVCYAGEQYDEVGAYGVWATSIKLNQPAKAGDKIQLRIVALTDQSSYVDITEAAINASQFVASGSNTERYLPEFLGDVANVKNFGAVGNGVNDDTTAFQSAIASGKAVFVPEGTYKLTEDFTGNFCSTGNSTFTGGTINGSAIIRGTAQKNNDIINVKDFGAKGDGETDDTEAFNLAVAAASKGIVFVPRGEYLISSETEEALWVIDGSAKILGSEDINGINDTSALTGRIIKFENDSGYTGIKIGANNPWLEDEIREHSEQISEVACLSPCGKIGLLAASRTSDDPARNMACIGICSHCVNDNVENPETAWSMYVEARRKNGAGNTFNIEMDAVNNGDTVPLTPFSALSQDSGVTVNCWITQGGGSSSLEGNTASAAIAVHPNPSNFLRGIVFRNGSLSDSTKEALTLPNGYSIAWYDNNDVLNSKLSHRNFDRICEINSDAGVVDSIQKYRGGNNNTQSGDTIYRCNYYSGVRSSPVTAAYQQVYKRNNGSRYSFDLSARSADDTQPQVTLNGIEDKSFSPYPTNTISLGTAGGLWSNIYAGSSTISTSDEREKESILDINDSLMKAWSKVNFIVFQFKEAVKTKGKNNARLHVGIIAQRVIEAFASEGLDARQYGILCYDKWDDVYEKDENGNETLKIKAGDRYGIRYEEALALECAYQRWLGEQRDAKIEALMQRISALENNR